MNRFWMGALVATLLSSRAAVAEPPPPVDVVIHDAPHSRRILAIEWNPLPLFTIGKLSANVVFVPVDHHALVISPFYARRARLRSTSSMA